MKPRIFLLLLFFFFKLFAQEQNENVLYVIDNVKVINDPERGNDINANDIEEVDIVKNKDSLKKNGLEKFDGVIYIFTKEFKKRSDELKKIPTTRNMEMLNGNIWHYNNKIYSGKFIDYYYSGRIQGEGNLLNGRLDGLRKMYFQNGNVSLERYYKNSIPNGLEQEFYEDGSLKQKGEFINGKEEGVWEMYYPNGKVKQRNIFKNGKMVDKSITFMSNGNEDRNELIIDGKILPDSKFAELDSQMKKSNEEYRNGNEKSAIKILSKLIDASPSFKDAYFSRGTMLLNQMKFDEAIKDFDKAIEIEPYYTFAITNRAFVRIRKYELGGRELLKNSEVTIIASKKEVIIPEIEKDKICSDLKLAVFLGDRNAMNFDALDKYCTKK